MIILQNFCFALFRQSNQFFVRNFFKIIKHSKCCLYEFDLRILRYVNNKRVTKNKGVPDETNGYNSGAVRLGGWRHLGPRSFKGLIDEVPVEDVTKFAAELREYLKLNKSDFIDEILKEKKLNEGLEATLKEVINEVKSAMLAKI